jgi:hypothetical protein
MKQITRVVICWAIVAIGIPSLEAQTPAPAFLVADIHVRPRS